MARLEEIRKRVENHQAGKVRPFSGRYMLDKDLPWLLERVSELEGQMDKAREQVYSDGRTIKRLYEANKELEAENERLKDAG